MRLPRVGERVPILDDASAKFFMHRFHVKHVKFLSLKVCVHLQVGPSFSHRICQRFLWYLYSIMDIRPCRSPLDSLVPDVASLELRDTGMVTPNKLERLSNDPATPFSACATVQPCSSPPFRRSFSESVRPPQFFLRSNIFIKLRFSAWRLFATNPSLPVTQWSFSSSLCKSWVWGCFPPRCTVGASLSERVQCLFIIASRLM